MRTSWIPVVLSLINLFVLPHPVEAKLPPCPGGRYLVSGGTLTEAAGAAEPDVVDVAGRMVSVHSGCDAVKARVRATAKGTKVRVKWKSCPGVGGGKAILAGTMMEQCRTLAGTFTARAAGIAKPFLASLSRCGDGVWDADGGEQCDAGLGPCGDLCNSCVCSGGTTTTTITSPGETTSTTTTPTMPTTSTTSGGGGTTTSTSSPVPTTTSTSSPVPTTTSTSSPVPTTTSTSSPVPTTTSTTSAVPTTTHTTTTSPIPTTTSTMFVIPTTTSSTAPGGGSTSSSTMPALPTTSTTSTTLAGPDLVGIAWMSPGSAPSGSIIAVQFTVKNVGNQTAVQPWYDYILLSGDYAVGNDYAVAVVQRTSNVAAGGQYTVLVPQVQLPPVPAGTYYLFLHTDGANAVAETNETNNLGGLVTINITP